MIRKLKVFGLALVAVCSMSAMVASAASAADFTTTSSATLTGTQVTPHKLTVTGQVVTCSSILFHGVAPGSKFSEVTISPRYTSCKTELGTTVTVTGFGHLAAEAGKPKCGYIIKASGASQLECEAGAEVTVDAGPCVVHIPAQSFGAGITYANEFVKDNPDDVRASFNIQGITGNHTDGFLCPFGSSGHNAEAVLEGEATVIAELANGVQVNATWDA